MKIPFEEFHTWCLCHLLCFGLNKGLSSCNKTPMIVKMRLLWPVSLSCCSVKLKKSKIFHFLWFFFSLNDHRDDMYLMKQSNLNGVRDTHSVDSRQWLIQNDDDACWICYWARLRFSEYFFLCSSAFYDVFPSPLYVCATFC